MKRLLLIVSMLAILALEVKAQWSTGTLSLGREYITATSVGTKAFFAGGETGSARASRVDIYDNSTNTWSTALLSQARRSLASSSVGNKAFFAGGFIVGASTNVVDIYDNSTNTWSTATLSEARNSLVATSVGTKVFFAGGTNSSSLKSAVVDIYDNSTNTWSTATLSQARDDLSAISVGSKVFFAGGNGAVASNVIDIYDNSNNTWSTATLSAPRYNLSATSVGNKVFFAGGETASTKSNVVDVYDNSNNTWSVASLSAARSAMAAGSVGTKIFFAGGLTTVGASNVVDIYDASTNTWSTDVISQARYNFSATSVGNKVLFGGGYTGSARSTVVDIYSATVTEPTAQPTNLTFSPVGFSEITLTYTAAAGTPEGYFIIRKIGSTPTAVPVDGTPYAPGATLGDAEVVYSGSNLTVNDNALFDGTNYFYSVFSYNGSGGAINYRTLSPLSGNQATGDVGKYFSRQDGNWNNPSTWSVIGPAGPIATEAPDGTSGENITISTGTTVTATGVIGIGGGRIEIQPGATLDAAGNDFNLFGSLIFDGTLLNAGAVIGSGSIASGGSALPVFEQIIYGGTFPGSGISLVNSDVVALNGAIPAAGDAVLDLNGFIIYPCIPPSNTTLATSPVFSNLNGTSMTLSWTNPGAGANGVLVVARAAASLIKPGPGSDYVANSVFGLGSETGTSSLNYVVYKGTGNTVTVTGLTPSTVYTFGIYQFNGTNCYNIRTMLEPTQNSGVNPPPVLTFNPLNAATNVSVSGNITITASETIRKIDNSPITAADLATLVELKLTNNAGAVVPFTANIDGTGTIITVDPTVTLSSNTIYYVELNPVEDSNNNAAAASSITFTTQAGPSITNVAPLSACVGQSVTITGTNFGTALPVVSVNSVSIPVTAHTATSITLLPAMAASGVVSVTNTDIPLGTVSASTLTISSLPNVFSVTGGGQYCVGGNGVTIGLSNSQSGVEYEVYLGATATGRKLTPGGGAFNFTGFFTAAGTYSVKGRNAGSCSSDMSGTAIVQVNVIPSGTGSISSSSIAICQNGAVDLTAVGFVNALTYEWTLPAGLSTTSSTSGSTINVKGDAAPGGIVSVSAKNNCGLSNPATRAITVNPAPTVLINAPPANEQIIDDVLQFTSVIDLPVSAYDWSFGDGGSSAEENPTHTYTSAGEFTVSLNVKTTTGCEGQAQVSLSITEFPVLATNAIKNMVTANEDGKNDRLIVVDIERFPNNTITVLDRWGVEVHKQNAYNNEWDFKKGGNYLPAGNYICIVKLNDSGAVITRTVTLVKK